MSTDEMDTLNEEETVEETHEESSEEVKAEGSPDLTDSELESYDAAEIEELENIEEERLDSIIESLLFATDRPISLTSIKNSFKGTTVKTEHIRQSIKRLQLELAGGRRGVSLEEVPGGYQLRTKIENLKFLTRSVKTRFFKLSGPALEVLAIVAYKQPVVKAEIDEIRGVESGHLLRALMEKGLICFEGKSELPGRPMQYGTTKKFLEIFGLRNLRELPTLSQIDELLPEGIGEDDSGSPKLAELTDKLSEEVKSTYSEGEEELTRITEQLQSISLSSEFFEEEKLRQKKAREAERARNIREALLMGEEVSNRDRKWLERYDESLKAGTEFVEESAATEGGGEAVAKAASENVPAGASESEDEAPLDEGRFQEEEDRSLDGDLNVDRHDEEDTP